MNFSFFIGFPPFTQKDKGYKFKKFLFKNGIPELYLHKLFIRIHYEDRYLQRPRWSGVQGKAC